MQIDAGTDSWKEATPRWCQSTAATEMEKVRQDWEAYGLKMPRLIYWNVNAAGKANILDAGPNVSFVSGCSPTIFKSVLTGKNGYDLMLEVLEGTRYKEVR